MRFRTTLILAGLMIVALSYVLATAAGLDHNATQIKATNVQREESANQLTACSLVKHNGTAASFYSGYQTGIGTYTYYDPAALCGAPTYPFAINDFSFTLHDPGGYVWPVVLDVVVYDLAASGNPCDGPGAEICRYTVTADQATFGFPTVGTFIFPSPCCVTRPFFIGVEYQSGTAGSTPSVLFDSNPSPISCDNWMFYTDGNYYEWYSFWTAPVPGYPIFFVDGDTESPDCGTLPCSWNQGDPFKMHFPQLPDESGWDVSATSPMTMADDWKCSESGWVKDIHFWGSWKDGLVGPIEGFTVKIHSDIPDPDPTDPATFSMPGPVLWERFITNYDVVQIDASTLEGWFDPSIPEVLPNNHQQYFQYNICLDQPDWYWQDQGTIYWLEISAVLDPSSTAKWGWKSTLDHYNDDAVWDNGTGIWRELVEPNGLAPITNGFFVQFDENGNFVAGSGDNAYGNGWYDYPSGWWNIWFYDHPYDDTRYKEITIAIDAFLLNTAAPGYLEFAVNWATDQWSIDQPPTDSMPPLPGSDETLYIGRQTFIASEDFVGHHIFTWVIPDYNPEWVSIDVRGFNFVIEPGTITHECKSQTPVSMDMSFVITGDPGGGATGACCYPDPTGAGDLCTVTTQTDCEQNLGGVYMGDGTTCSGIEACCLPDGSCLNVDALCCELVLGGVPQGPGSQCTSPASCCFQDGTCQDLDPLCCESLGGTPTPGALCSPAQACCLPDGSCDMLDPICCALLGGTPGGTGSQCSDTTACCFQDGTCQNLDPVCCTQLGGTPSPGVLCGGTVEACCLPDGSCQNLDPACCIGLGGTPGGAGTQCGAAAEACCFTDGSCQNLFAVCCTMLGGSPQGAGTACQGDADGDGVDDACGPQTGACCFDDGSCLPLTQADCMAAGGHYLGNGSVCLGDNNGNGEDDACETWLPGDDYKMHYPQLPDPRGWDVNATYPMVLADDWRCSETGWIKDFHFWGSWLNGAVGNIVAFNLSVHSDIPAAPPQIPYSRPGDILWELNVDNFNQRAIDPSALEGWYNPATGVTLPNNHDQYFQYDVYLDSINWFWQDSGTIYWFNVSAILETGETAKWGWKSTRNHFNDDAVWALIPDYGWIDLYEPDVPLTRVDTFAVEVDPTGQVVGGGSNSAYGEGWYFYPLESWWNIWFYDHPFSYNRFKTITIDLPGGEIPLDPTAFVEIAVNWSTDAWSNDQPPGDSAPPLPGAPEDLYIGRATLYQGDPNPQPQTYTFQIPDYNPEWVSIDIRGSGFAIPAGIISHTCRIQPPGQSLDLSFVVTGEAPCTDLIGDADGSGAIDIDDAVYLIAYIFSGGPAPVPWTVASGDANCDCAVDIDDIVYLIAYIFNGGPPPCDCQTWIANCGPLH